MPNINTRNVFRNPNFVLNPRDVSLPQSTFTSYSGGGQTTQWNSTSVGGINPQYTYWMWAFYNTTQSYGFTYKFNARPFITTTSTPIRVAFSVRPDTNATIRCELVEERTGFKQTVDTIIGAGAYNHLNIPFTLEANHTYSADATGFSVHIYRFDGKGDFRLRQMMLNPYTNTVYKYFDGNLVGAKWDGPPNVSESIYKVTTTLGQPGSGRSSTFGRAFLGLNDPIPLRGIKGRSFSYGLTRPFGVTPYPAGAFDDFAIAPLSHYDPAMTLIPRGQRSTGTNTTWTRPWARQTAPLEYPISGTKIAWPKAAFASVVVRWPQVPDGKGHLLDLVQFEKSTKSAPSTWEVPREINVNVKPERINYSINPSAETNLNQWTSYGSNGASVTKVGFSEVETGTQVVRVRVAPNPPPWSFLPWQGANHAVPNLVPGKRYVFSARVYRAQGCPPVFVALPGDFPAGSGVLETRNEWETISHHATPTGTTFNMSFFVNQEEMLPNVEAVFYVDTILVEDADTIGEYFDGSFEGQDYSWSSAGPAHNTRSLYYSGRRHKQNRLEELLKQNLPVGAGLKITYTE